MHCSQNNEKFKLTNSHKFSSQSHKPVFIPFLKSANCDIADHFLIPESRNVISGTYHALSPIFFFCLFAPSPKLRLHHFSFVILCYINSKDPIYVCQGNTQYIKQCDFITTIFSDLMSLCLLDKMPGVLEHIKSVFLREPGEHNPKGSTLDLQMQFLPAASQGIKRIVIWQSQSFLLTLD